MNCLLLKSSHENITSLAAQSQLYNIPFLQSTFVVNPQAKIISFVFLAFTTSVVKETKQFNWEMSIVIDKATVLMWFVLCEVYLNLRFFRSLTRQATNLYYII